MGERLKRGGGANGGKNTEGNNQKRQDLLELVAGED